MLNAILGQKLSQTQVFTSDGMRIPVTEIVTGPCSVVQIKNTKHDGYWALQLGFGSRKAKNTPKPIGGHLKKTGQGNFLPRFLREVRLDLPQNQDQELPFKVGEPVKVDQVLKVGDVVKVSGVTKAKGFQGGVKRHGFAGGPRTHGQSDRERAPGSIGQTTTPGRVYKGKRMAGHTGGVNFTVKGLKVVSIDPEKQLVQVKGLVPGRVKGLVLIQKQK